MLNFKVFLNTFWKEEEGVEVLEVVAIIAACCLVVSVIMALYSAMSEKISDVQTQVEGLDMTF